MNRPTELKLVESYGEISTGPIVFDGASNGLFIRSDECSTCALALSIVLDKARTISGGPAFEIALGELDLLCDLFCEADKSVS